MASGSSRFLFPLIFSDFDDMEVVKEYMYLENLELKKIKKVFDLDVISAAECRRRFRFEREDLPRLQEALQIPETFHVSNGIRVSGLEALCMLLRRFAYPH